MRIIFSFFALLLIAGIITLRAQDDKKQSAEGMEAMKKWMEAATPNEHHKALDGCVGKWDMVTSTWMGGPGTAPMVTKGTAEISWMLGGRFLKQDAKGEFMGQPYAGIGLTGYDNNKKCYTMLWIDNTTTAMSAAEGNVDQTGKIFTLYGKMDEPTTGEHDKNVKYVMKLVNKDKFMFEVHDLTFDEPNTKIMEITYTRAK